jgi:biuret amidohydrolase
MNIGDSAFLPLDGWEPVNPARAALVIVDMQYATGSRHGAISKIWEKQGHQDFIDYRFGRLEKLVIPNVQKLLQFFRQNNLRVLYLTYGSEINDFSDLTFLVKRIALPTNNRRGSKEHEILEEIKPLENEMVINKTTIDAFASCNIDNVLRLWGTEFALFVGVSTHACVDSTARGAADRGYKCIMINDGTAGFSQALQEATTQNFAGCFGRVELTDNIIKEMSSQLKVK